VDQPHNASTNRQTRAIAQTLIAWPPPPMAAWDRQTFLRKPPVFFENRGSKACFPLPGTRGRPPFFPQPRERFSTSRFATTRIRPAIACIKPIKCFRLQIAREFPAANPPLQLRINWALSRGNAPSHPFSESRVRSAAIVLSPIRAISRVRFAQGPCGQQPRNSRPVVCGPAHRQKPLNPLANSSNAHRHEEPPPIM